MNIRIAAVGVLVALTLAFALGRGEEGETLALPHGDAMYYYVYLPSLWLDGDVDFDDEYAVTGNPWQMPRTSTGRAGNVFGIGPALFASPLFLIGHAVARIGGLRADGFSSVEIWLAGFASVLASVAALVLAYRLLARRLGESRRALAAALLAFAGGPLVFYAVRQPHMAHPFAVLFATWLVDAWDASYDRPRTLRTWITLGALLGAAFLARPQLAPWGLCLALAALDDLRRERSPRTLARIAAGGLATLLVVLPQLVTWKINYGAFLVVPQGPDFMRWDAPAWSETLFSSRNGLFPWTPVYAVALVGLVVGLRRWPRLVGALLAAFVTQILVNGAAWDWWAGGSFGARRYESLYPAFALGLGFLLARWPRVIGAFIAYLAIINVALALTTTPVSMRQKGGGPASAVMRDQLGVIAVPAAWLSSLANLPARILFAWRHGTSLAAYDDIVGVHWLQETYPALSTKLVRTQARRLVADIPRMFVDGFVDGDALATGRGRVLIGLNLRGTVHVTLQTTGPATAHWNDAAVTGLAFDVEPVRGTNELVIEAPAGTRVISIELRTPSR